TDELNGRVGEDHEAAARIAVAWLADTAHVDYGFFIGRLKFPFQLVGAVIIRPFQEHAWHVGMPDETEFLKPFDKAYKLAGIGVDVVRKDVFVDRAAGRSMDGHELRRAQPNRQIAQELPAAAAALRLGIGLETIARPIAGLLRAAVKVVRLVKDRKIVI